MGVPSQTELEEGYKQARVNARCKALDIVLVAYQAATGELKRDDTGTGPIAFEKAPLTADHMVEEAKKLEAYMLEGIEVPKIPSIIRATTGPSH